MLSTTQGQTAIPATVRTTMPVGPGGDLQRRSFRGFAVVRCAALIRAFPHREWTFPNVCLVRGIGEPGTSADCFRRALSVRQHTGDRHGQAQTLRALGDLLQELCEADAAYASWQQALTIFEELGDPQAGELRARLRGSKTGISR